MALPYFQTPVTQLSQLQTTWKSQLDPLLAQALSNGIILKDVKLIHGDTVINTTLGRAFQGWFPVAPKGPATIFQTASQPMPALQLTLTSSAAITTDLFIF